MNAPRFALLAPALDGPPTGGTVYNAELVAALLRAGVACPVHPPEASTELAGAGVLLADSLCLPLLPELRRRFPDSTLIALLHYLPSLVRSGPPPTAPSTVERAALRAADGCVVTSGFMHDFVSSFAELPVCCIEPGVPVRETPRARAPRPTAVMLCSVVEAKGVLALLEALANRTRDHDRYALRVAGRLDVEPHYTAACRSLLVREAKLRSRVELLGPLLHDRALALLLNADALISASRMESYGMSLGEARALGIPILATAGGHSGAQVRAEWGGSLLPDVASVAEHWIELARDPPQLAARMRAAQAHQPRRSWDEAAAELISFVSSGRL